AERDRAATARHYILQPQHVLSDAEQAELAASGVTIQRALPGLRYLVRVANDSTFDASDPRVVSMKAITASDKLTPSAYRVAAAGNAFARVNVIFHQDASMDDAISAIESIGGTFEDAMALDFSPVHSITARIPAASLQALASDERVMMVYGATPHRAVSYNATAAAMSHINEVQAAPYNLSGNGVTLSFFELAPADPSHPEFQGRLTVHFQCRATGDSACTGIGPQQHPTHVSGTMIAAGLNP